MRNFAHCKVAQEQYDRSVKDAASRFEVLHFGKRSWSERSLKSLENMVARDGLEPPTPAFSGLRSTT